MKEIGEKLKEARESIGVSIEEAAADLKMSVKQLEDLEIGNMDAFKDVINVKYLIRDYAKYLGLDKEDLVDDFNEYLFDYTSKISLDDIKNAKDKVKEKAPKVRSPYTVIREKKQVSVPVIVLLCIVCLCIIVGVIYYKDLHKKTDNIIAYAEVIK